MELDDLAKISSLQDSGHVFELLDPVRGDPTGIKLRIAGPDSQIAKKARDELMRAIDKVPVSRQDTRDRLMADFLFAVTLDWQIEEGGEPLTFTRENFMRLLNAGTWIRGQIDLFAGDRSPYFGG